MLGDLPCPVERVYSTFSLVDTLVFSVYCVVNDSLIGSSSSGQAVLLARNFSVQVIIAATPGRQNLNLLTPLSLLLVIYSLYWLALRHYYKYQLPC